MATEREVFVKLPKLFGRKKSDDDEDDDDLDDGDDDSDDWESDS